MIRRFLQSELYKQHAVPLIVLLLAIVVIRYPITLLDYTTARAPIVNTGAPTFQQIPDTSLQVWPVQDSYASATQDEPWSVLIGSSLRSGSLPVINLFNGLGAPLAETMQAGVFYPLNVVLTVLPMHNPIGFDLFVLLHLLIFLYGLYALYALFGPRWIATTVALLIGSSGMVYSNINMVHFRSFAWVPWILFFAIVLLRSVDVSRKRVVLLTLGLTTAIVCQVTAGSLQDSCISLAAVICIIGLFALTQRPRVSLMALLRVCGAFASGVLLSSLAFVPFFVARAADVIHVQEGGFRVLQSVNWYHMATWILPKFKGVFPFYIYSEIAEQSQPDIPTVAWLGVGITLVVLAQGLWLRGKGRGELWFMVALIGLLVLGFIKVMHIPLFDFLQYIPFVESLKFAKYHLWIGVVIGLIATWGFAQWEKENQRMKRWLVLGSFGLVLSVTLVLFIVAASQGNAPWQAQEGIVMPLKAQQEVGFSLVTNLVGLFVFALVLFFVKSAARRWQIAFCTSVFVLAAMMPYGWYERSVEWIDPDQNHALQSVVDRIVRDPSRDPNDRPRLLITRPHSNQSLIGGYESVVVWDPILHARYQQFVISHFPVGAPDLVLQPTPGSVLGQPEIDALRFLGVDAITGYALAPEKNITYEIINGQEVYFLDHTLPRAFFLTTEQAAAVTALQQDGVSLDVLLGELLAAIEINTQAGISVQMQQIRTNGMQVQVSGSADGHLIVLQAGSPQWKLDGQSAGLFLDLYPTWSVNIDGEKTVEVHYELSGIRLIIILTSIGLLFLLCVIVLPIKKSS